MTSTDAIIYLRLSDFRDEEDTTFTAREEELRDFAAGLHLNVIRVAVENDVNGAAKSASAYKTPVKVTTPSGLLTFRTNRPVFQAVALDLQRGVAGVLIVGDDSRISRNHRDGNDLLDACQVSRASVVAPDEDGNPRWILTDGGSHSQVSAFLDRINDARKFSDDIAVKVRKGRRRWAGKSYGGGRRPYGYRPDPDGEEHRRNLLIVPEEAALLRQAAADILDRGITIGAIARDYRDRGIPTVTGAAWSARTVKDVLIKPTIAGIAVHKGEHRDAPWEPILDREVWARLRDKLTDPARTTTTGNEPRWLLSKIATCGICGASTRVSGGTRDRRIQCDNTRHMSRSVAQVEEFITALVIGRLSQSDIKDLLRPPVPAGVDAGELRAELRELRKRKAAQVKMHAAGDIDDTDLAVGVRAIRERMTVIEGRLAVSDAADPLAEFRDKPADVVWASLTVARKRAVVRLLMDVKLVRCKHIGPRFNPDGVEVTWKVPAPVAA